MNISKQNSAQVAPLLGDTGDPLPRAWRQPNPRRDTDAARSVSRWQLGIFFMFVLAGILLAASDRSEPLSVADAQEIKHTYKSVAMLQRAGADLAVERGLVYLALQVPLEERAAWRAAIENNRTLVDQALEDIRDKSVVSRWNNVTWPVARMSSHSTHLDRLRAITERHLEAPLTNTSRNMANVWMRETTAIIRNLSNVAQVLQTRIAYADPASRHVLKLNRFAAEIAEVAGRERAIIAAAAAADRGLTDRLSGILDAYARKTRDDWKRIRLVMKSAPVDGQIAEIVESAQEEYSRTFEDQASRMLNVRKETGAYPISADEWFAASSRAIESIHEIGFAVANAGGVNSTL